jgi:hypothetical protein
MEMNIYTWLIGALVVIVIVAIIAKRFSANLSKKGFSIKANKQNLEKTNKIVIKGENHVIKQDVNNEGSSYSSKNNELDIDGKNHNIEQDTNNKDQNTKE